MVYPDYWTCPNCGSIVNKSSYCTHCAYEPQKQGYPHYWQCPQCNATVNNSANCPNCSYNPTRQVIKKREKSSPLSKRLFLIGSSLSVAVIVIFVSLMIFRPSITPVINNSVNDQLQQINERINFLDECKPDWECGEWGPCEGPIQSRECVDANDCGTLYFRPEISRLCED